MTAASDTPRPSQAHGAPVGPGSLLWHTAGDPRSLLTGTAAGIMQLMLPGLGAGVTDHSDFFNDPFDRIFRSVPLIWGSIFAEDDEQGTERGHAIRDFHPDIKGIDHKGRHYHALDPDVFWWAHATFTWEFLRARELYFPVPLSRSQKEQLYAETVTWYRRYGVSDRPVPPTWVAFEKRFEEICRDELEMTPAVKWVLDPGSNPATGGPPAHFPWPLSALDGLVTGAGSEMLRVMVYGNMPDTVRRRFDFDWSNTDRLTFMGFCAAVRAADPAVKLGRLEALFPEGTPHLHPRDPDRVIVAGPNPNQRARRSAVGAS